eukprot:COSAG02_NODE_506_length_20931_cov_20.533218_11_plen_48_part_00
MLFFPLIFPPQNPVNVELDGRANHPRNGVAVARAAAAAAAAAAVGGL